VVEKNCDACGAEYVLTRHSRYQWLKAGSPLCCSVCHTLFGLPFESGRWSKRLIRKGQAEKGGYTLREARLLLLMLLAFSGFLTWHIPGAIAYPKHHWGDWLVVYLTVALVCAGWFGTLATLRQTLRLHGESRHRSHRIE